MRKVPLLLFVAFALLIGNVPIASAQFYTQQNLISDLPGVAVHQDSHVVNAWGLASGPVTGPATPWWIANNGDDTSSLYNASNDTIPPLVVSIPGGAPTGIVFNNSGGGFVVSSGAASGSAVFIFASEAGIISGWSPNVPPPPTSTQAQIGATVPDAIYKGLAIAGSGAGARLYATNFHAGNVDVFDNTFSLLSMPAGAFVDPDLPPGFAPFGIQNIGGTLYVTYALQDADKEDDVAGVGLGYVDQFDTSGNLLRRVASKGPLNAPWGLALAPDDFGIFSNMLLVGSFGDGKIHAYDVSANVGGEAPLVGQLHTDKGPPLRIDGLWALQFGNDGGAGSSKTLFFTAGPFDEDHGLFGSLTVAGAPGHNKKQ